MGDTGSQQRQRLLGYLALLERWGRTYNLTAIRDPLRMVGHHLLDSLSVLVHLDDLLPRGTGRVLDMGSGAGLPGLPLAVLRPELNFALNDAVGKKAAFMRQAAADLGLANVAVVHGRIEELAEAEWDVVLARALAPLPELVRLAAPRLAPGGWLVALKGELPQHEHVPSMLVTRLDVPFVEGTRHVVRVSFAGKGTATSTAKKGN